MHKNAPKNDQGAALAIAIGQRMRQERQAQGWTLDRLAEMAGVSRRMLINVEQGAANPSVGTLLRISDALGIGLPALVAVPETRPVTVTRHGDGAVLWRGEKGGRGVLVAGTEPPNVVELWEWTLAPGDRHASEDHSAGTWELLQVVEGTIVVTVGEETVRLEPGDAMSFPGDIKHAYENEEKQPARFTLCVYEPGVGKADHQ